MASMLAMLALVALIALLLFSASLVVSHLVAKREGQSIKSVSVSFRRGFSLCVKFFPTRDSVPTRDRTDTN